MKIHEYQAKEILRKYNIPLPQGNVAFSIEEALNIAKKFPSEISVVKAQIHAGGRGKGGGVKVCKNLKELEENAEKILGMNLVTPQTSCSKEINFFISAFCCSKLVIWFLKKCCFSESIFSFTVVFSLRIR